ncbi:uncharacterized protein LOC130809018 [Amaranthus tricolor]|uniref:uncharacterized protein LOC130809018 n=1 Tax=Amaranthus tricolor TaxID=29722 RepID=UPI0025841B01|nr:uncharacterized protein LOC130809018 [Amaranthus tricolor]
MVPAATSLAIFCRRIQHQNSTIPVFELETTYLQDSNHFGHVLKGFEGFLSSSKSTTNMKRLRKFQPEDRIFSMSSVTSPTICKFLTCGQLNSLFFAKAS